MSTLTRKLANSVMMSAMRAGCPERREWTAAMATEFDYITSDWAALEFAIGCFSASFKETQFMQKYEPLMRWFLAVCITVWAMAQIYLLMAFSTQENIAASSIIPNWFLISIAGAALAYGGCAYFLFRKKLIAFGIALAAALFINSGTLAINAISYAQVDFQNTEHLVLYLALIGEDYFIWTLILMGILVIWTTKNFEMVHSALLQR